MKTVGKTNLNIDAHVMSLLTDFKNELQQHDVNVNLDETNLLFLLLEESAGDLIEKAEDGDTSFVGDIDHRYELSRKSKNMIDYGTPGMGVYYQDGCKELATEYVDTPDDFHPWKDVDQLFALSELLGLIDGGWNTREQVERVLEENTDE
ncbi:hypothetical protein [Haladaptatus cibarius]|uniref:hypothetical protein n=1 Tax=Haladaptatus cibarius TaxID=453847 RepID=UPI000679E866|nr:hypothetical protein [Haladaptatus cibarius]